jgi:hypothetical protein
MNSAGAMFGQLQLLVNCWWECHIADSVDCRVEGELLFGRRQ